MSEGCHVTITEFVSGLIAKADPLRLELGTASRIAAAAACF